MRQLELALAELTCDIRTTEGRDALTEVMLSHPQAPCAVINRLGPGIYIREAMYPANMLIVGATHVGEHLNVLLQGSIRVLDGAGNASVLHAPYIFTAPAGAKIGYTLTDVVWQNIYATTETDFGILGATLFETPEVWKAHLREKLERETTLHEDDRADFRQMLCDMGMTPEFVETLSAYTGDRTPFPYAGYGLTMADSPIQGRGLFSTCPAAVGTILAPMRIDGMRTPAGYLINHSATPNVRAVAVPDSSDLYIEVIVPLAGMSGGDVGDEITLDYRQVLEVNPIMNMEGVCQQG